MRGSVIYVIFIELLDDSIGLCVCLLRVNLYIYSVRAGNTHGPNDCHVECLKRTVMQTTLKQFYCGWSEEAHQSSANSLRV